MAKESSERLLALILSLVLLREFDDEEDDFPYRRELLYRTSKLLREQSLNEDSTGSSEDARQVYDLVERMLMRASRTGRSSSRLRYLVREEVGRAFESSRASEYFLRFLEPAVRERAASQDDQLRRLENRLNERMSDLQEAIQANEARALQANSRAIEASRELREYFIVTQAGDDYSKVQAPRYIPIQIYLTEDSPQRAREAIEALSKLLSDINIKITDEYEAESGSWFQRIIGKTKGAVSQAELDEHVSNAKRALELALVEKRQAEVDREKAEAALKLAEALGDSGHGVIGSIVVMKSPRRNGKSETRIFELTQEQLVEYRRMRNSGKIISSRDILAILDGQTKREDGLIEGSAVGNGPDLGLLGGKN